MNASIEIQNGVKTLSGAPADAKYYNNSGNPYTDVNEVNTQIPSALRGRGLTVNISGVEYWYKDGILDTDLVLKTSGAEGHTHDNKTTLDKIGESAGNPTWNGSAWPGSGGVAPTADNVNTALQGFTEGTPQDSDFLVFIGKIKITLANFKTLLATALNNTFASKTHAHAQTDITGLSTALAGKQDVLGFTPEQAGVAATLISNLKNGVSSEGDTLKKLYDLIVASYSEITVPDTNNRNAYNVTKLPTNIFVTNDGDGKWALYKCISTGINRGNDVKISDPDLLNAVMTASQIKTAYESNADTNAFTNALLDKLNAFTATFTSELKTAYDAAVTAAHSHSNKAILDAIQVAYTTAMNNKLSGIADNANNYVHPTGDGNQHVPATGTTNAGKVLTAGATAGSMTWETPASVTPADNSITNAKLAQIATGTIKGRKTTGAGNVEDLTAAEARAVIGVETDQIPMYCSDMTSDLTASTTVSKLRFMFEEARTLQSVVGSLATAATGSVLTVDIKKNGTSIFSTLLTFDSSENTTRTAATPAVLTGTIAFAIGDYIDIYVTTVGSVTAGKGLLITLLTKR